MKLTIITGNPYSGKSKIAIKLADNNPKTIILTDGTTLGSVQAITMQNKYNNIITDDCSEEINNYLKTKADYIFHIKCERIK